MASVKYRSQILTSESATNLEQALDTWLETVDEINDIKFSTCFTLDGSILYSCLIIYIETPDE